MIEETDEIAPSSATEFDVAAYILQSLGSTTSLKLQLLLFYCQACSLEWDERTMFESDFVPFKDGPKSELYVRLRGNFKADMDLIAGDPTALDEDAMDTVNKVLGIFGDKTSQWLGRLIRSGEVWPQVLARRPNHYDRGYIVKKGELLAFYAEL